MQPFEYFQPTQVIAGEGVAVRTGSLASLFGSRALVVTGAEGTRSSGALADVLSSLDAAGLGYDLLEGVPPNPSVAIVDAGAALMRSNDLDVVIAVGGGSVIDTAKAVATGAIRGGSYRTLLSGIRSTDDRIDASAATIAIPTLPGSGSETNGTSVIIDEISGRKLSAHSELAAPRVALLDPTYAAKAPRQLIAEGCADAMSHAIEAGLSVRASHASDSLAIGAVALLGTHAVKACKESVEDIAACLWAANIAGQALSLAGSIVTHPLAHPLSARCGAHHGAAVAAIEPATLAARAEHLGAAGLKVARWLGAKPRSAGSASSRAVLQRLAKFNAAIGIEQSAGDLGLSSELAEQMIEDVMLSGSRGLANTPGPELTRADLLEIYERALHIEPHKEARI